MKFGGLKFLEASHVKDVLAVLRWAQNMRDRVSGFRVAQLLPGIGPAAAARLLEGMQNAIDPLQGLSAYKPPSAAAEHWAHFEETLSQLRRNVFGWPTELEVVCRWYAPHLEREHHDAPIRQADLLQLTQIAASYPSRERFSHRTNS